FWLLFWGILIYSVRDGHLNWQLSNVLTQLAFTTLIAFSVINQPVWLQLTASVLCLLIPEFLFRFIHIPGFDQPFVEFHNFGSFINKSLGIKIDLDHKTNFINFITSGAHTIWGVMSGQLLFFDKWLNGYVEILVSQLLNLAAVPLAAGAAISCIIVFMMEWYLCYYLYKKKIFFKI